MESDDDEGYLLIEFDDEKREARGGNPKKKGDDDAVQVLGLDDFEIKDVVEKSEEDLLLKEQTTENLESKIDNKVDVDEGVGCCDEEKGILEGALYESKVQTDSSIDHMIGKDLTLNPDLDSEMKIPEVAPDSSYSTVAVQETISERKTPNDDNKTHLIAEQQSASIDNNDIGVSQNTDDQMLDKDITKKSTVADTPSLESVAQNKKDEETLVICPDSDLDDIALKHNVDNNKLDNLASDEGKDLQSEHLTNFDENVAVETTIELPPFELTTSPAETVTTAEPQTSDENLPLIMETPVQTPAPITTQPSSSTMTATNKSSPSSPASSPRDRPCYSCCYRAKHPISCCTCYWCFKSLLFHCIYEDDVGGDEESGKNLKRIFADEGSCPNNCKKGCFLTACMPLWPCFGLYALSSCIIDKYTGMTE